MDYKAKTYRGYTFDREGRNISDEKNCMILEFREVLQRFNIKEEKRVLDVGCGQGFIGKHLPKFWAEMIGIDRMESEIKHITEFPAYVMDAENTTFPDNHFDMIICKSFLHHIDIDKFMTEANRILKPNGRFIAIKEFPLPGKILYFYAALIISMLYSFRFPFDLWKYSNNKIREIKERGYSDMSRYKKHPLFCLKNVFYYELFFAHWVLIFYPIQNKLKFLHGFYVWTSRKIVKLDILCCRIIPQCLLRWIVPDMAFELEKR